jgi:Spy/CpxP family protein refolding chaperone
MKHVSKLSIIAAIALAVAGRNVALAEQGEGQGPRGGHGPALDHLLPKHAVEDLNLTADQKAKFDELEKAFKKDAAKWREAHPDGPEEFQKAKDADDKPAMEKLKAQRKELMDTRKGYVDQFRASLTDEQKTKLDKMLENLKAEHGPGKRQHEEAK